MPPRIDVTSSKSILGLYMTRLEEHCMQVGPTYLLRTSESYVVPRAINLGIDVLACSQRPCNASQGVLLAFHGLDTSVPSANHLEQQQNSLYLSASS